MFRPWLALLLLGLAGWAGSLAWAQSDAQALLEDARQAAAEARTAYDIDTPDRPLWSEALQLARQAQALEPENLEIIRFLALTYSEVHWYVRAFDVWVEYLDAGGDLEPLPEEDGLTAAEAFAEAGNQLGFSRYQAGNLAAASGYYQRVLSFVSNDPEALYWLGRINLELDEAEAARGYFERLLAEQPEHETAAYYLTLIDEREQVGEEASRAYREGLSAYEEGRLAQSHDAFVRAVQSNSGFADAAAWSGRTALELERPEAAVGYWERALALRPGDPAARYFLEVARTQAQWGVAAGRAFVEGQSAYQQGELEMAAAAFSRAVEANPEMIEAWIWAARSAQELGRAEAAIEYWQGVLERQPENEQASYSIEVARQQLAFGQEAGLAFAQAVRHYQLAEFDRAEQGFRRAVEANPGFASAWGWLGRLYFTRGEYAQAAEAYARAYELEPANEDYAFFAEEARFLAGDGG